MQYVYYDLINIKEFIYDIPSKGVSIAVILVWNPLVYLLTMIIPIFID